MLQCICNNSEIQMKLWIILAGLVLAALSSSLHHCVEHVLHHAGNEDFTCKGEVLHFYSTYVLPDGAYSCLPEMREKQGFYVSTVKQFGHLSVSEQEVAQGFLQRQDMRTTGWKCNSQGRVTRTNFKGVRLHLQQCRHNETGFEDICIIKGWPLQQQPMAQETL